MAEISFFDVSFKDPSATYKAGDVVAGKVNLHLNMELKMKGVKMFLQGASRVNWDEKRSYTKGSSSQVSHKNVDVYLDEPLMLCSRVEGSLMKKGRYEWPFSVRLPTYIPATFEGQYGKVQYWAKVAIDQPWKKDTEIQKFFTVQGTLDLNTEGDAKKPVDNTHEIMVGTMCCKSGPVTGTISLQKRGFVSGQNVPFIARINNKSSKMVRDIHVTLVQQVTYRADRVRKQTTLLKGLGWRDVNPGENASWDGELKNIPNVVPSRLGGGCKNIEVKYLVQLTGRPKGMGVALEIPVEIVVGTIPMRNTEGGEPVLTVRAATRQKQEGLALPGSVTSKGMVRASPNPSPVPPRRTHD